MALYFHFNETTGDLVYSDQATYGVAGYVSLGQQTDTDPNSEGNWVFHSRRANIKTVTKDPNMSGQINILTSMSNMFIRCVALTSIDLSGFDTSNVTDMSKMFYSCLKLTSLDLSGFDTSNVTDMSRMFYNCLDIASLDLSSFDTSNVTNMGAMFSGCLVLTSLDLSSFNTSNVTDMSNMFSSCPLVSPDLSSFDTSNVTNMNSMFSVCQHLVSLDLSGFNTSNVTDMSAMFSGCLDLTSLDLSSFNTSNVKDMVNMFAGCTNLVSLDLSSFDTSNAMNINHMFEVCLSLRVIDISPNMSNVLSELPTASYYDAVTRQSYAKASIPGGSTYVRDLTDLDFIATMVQTRMGINVAKRLAHGALRKASSIDINGSSVDVVRTGQHQASYDRDTLELVTDGTGKVTEMWLVTAG